MLVLKREGTALGDAKIEPPLGENVDRRDIFRDLNGIAKGDQHRRGAEPYAARDSREIGEQCQDRRAHGVRVEMMFGDPGFVYAEGFRVLDIARLHVETAGKVALVVFVGAKDADAHRRALVCMASPLGARPIALMRGRPRKRFGSPQPRSAGSDGPPTREPLAYASQGPRETDRRRSREGMQEII